MVFLTFCRTVGDIPLFLDDHLDRFFDSAAVMRLECFLGREEMRATIYELIRLNALGESGIKMILTGGYAPEGFELTDANLVIVQQKLQVALTGTINKGIHVITHEYQRDLPAVKSINYLMAVWLQQKVRDHHADDVLYCPKWVGVRTSQGKRVYGYSRWSTGDTS
jgi:D-alanine transaminase/branched-chain amino acid aminotransferase